MKYFFSLSLVLFALSAHATLWITLSHPRSDKIAVVGASSGNIGDYKTMVSVDNHGIAVVGSWYLDRRQDHLKYLMRNETLTAREVAKEFSRLINLDSHKRRVSFVNDRFENASEPGRGCHSDNYYCGKYEAEHFTITGGGLVSPEVINAGRVALENPRIQTLPVECQLYLAMKAMFDAGIEFKTVNRLTFLIDDLRRERDNRIHLYFRKESEQSLLDQFMAEVKSRGISCAQPI